MIQLNGPGMCLALVLLLCCDSSVSAMSYRNISLKNWCDSHPLIKAVRRIISNPAKEIYVTRDFPLEINHRWETTYNNECQFRVEAETGKGLIMNINQMYLRYYPFDITNCVDYLRLRFVNDTKSDRICGFVNGTGANVRRSFLIPEGSVELKIRINDHRQLAWGHSVYVNLLFTQYNNECDRTKDFPCGPDTCIDLNYVNDGRVNCPYPNCLDEQRCYKNASEPDDVSYKTRVVIGGIVLALMLSDSVPIMICCCWEYCRYEANGAGRTAHEDSNNGNRQGARRHRRNRHRSHNRSGSQSDTTEGINMTVTSSNANAPQKESPPPTYESLFPSS